MDCPHCRTSNPPAATLCRTCHTPLPGSVITKTPPPLDEQTIVDSLQTTTGGEGQALTDRPETLGGETVTETPADMAVPTGWSVPAPSPTTGRVAGSLEALQPGTLLANRYEIIRLLGQGGMGAVYQAKDRELDRLVALKIIRPELARRPENLQRFKQELILARQVTHRNVIRIFDLGEAEGMKFITMAYVEGQDLKTIMAERGKLNVEESVRIIQQVCLALEAAHAEGVVHRDLKPQNIMVDKQGRAYVMDFGIARDIELGGGTQTGALVGTPEYMSPEQVQGRKADARSDLFTLGIIFYELLTGKTPYVADTALGTMYKRTQERAAPPAQLDPSVPHFLSDLVGKCLEMEPQRRYQSAREILHDLEAWQLGTSRRALNPVVRWWRYGPRYQKRAAIFLPVVVLAVTGLIFLRNLGFFSKSSVPYPQVSLAILPFRNASGDPRMDWLGASLAEMLATDVGQSSSLRTVSAERIHQILRDLRLPANSEFDPATLRRLAEFSSAETLVWGQYVKMGDQIRIDATLEDVKRQRALPLKVTAATEKDVLQAVQQLAQSIQQNLRLPSEVLKELRAKSFLPSSQSLPALRYYHEGLELSRQGNPMEAAKRFEASINADPDFALAYSTLGQTYSILGYDEKAEQFSRKALDLSDKLPAQQRYLIEANYAQIKNDNRKAIESYENLAKVSPDDLDVHFRVGELYEKTGVFDKARDEFAKVLTLDPKHVDALLAAGRVEIRRNNPQGSLDDLNRALSLAVDLDNADAKARILDAIGVAYKQLNKPEEALRYYQESLAIQQRLGQKRGIAVTLGEIARVQAGLGKPAEAHRGYQEALQLQREIGDKKGLGVTLINLGEFYKAREQYDEALKVYKESLQIQRDVGNENNQSICLNNIGNVYLAKGQFSDALTYYERALELRNKAKIPSQIGETLHNLAEASLKLGEYEQSLDYHLRALELFRSSSGKRGAAIQLYSMGTIFEYQGRYGAALKSKEEALTTFRDLQEHSLWMAEILGGYGHSLSQIGRYDEAQKSLDEALSLARQLQNNTKIAQTLNFQGDTFFYRGDLPSAANLFSQALAATSGTSEHEVILLSKLNVAKNAVKEGRHQAGVASLKTLIREADALGLKYLSTDASLELAEAFLNTRQYSAARKELDVALQASERLGLQALLARSHYLLGRTLALTGSGPEASRHYVQARRLLEAIHQEAGTDAILKREDLSPISTELAPKP